MAKRARKKRMMHVFLIVGILSLLALISTRTNHKQVSKSRSIAENKQTSMNHGVDPPNLSS